eukprot:gene11596-4839_t
MKLVIVGAGHSSSQLIRKLGELKNKYKNSIEITLINEYPFSLYSGMIPGVISEQYTINEAMLDNKKLIEFANGNLIVGRASSIDWSKKLILCEDTTEESKFFSTKEFKDTEETNLIKVEFDVLVIDVGSVARNTEIKGINEFTIPTRPISKLVYKIEEFERKTKKKDDFKVKIIGGGAAGIEIACCLQQRFSKKCPEKNFNFEILDKNSSFEKSLNSDSLSSKTSNQLKNRKIKTTFNVNISEIQENDIIFDNEKSIDFDLCIYAAGSQASPFLKKSGMKTDDHGYLLVNDKLQSISHPNVFAAGDCISFDGGPIVPKAGVYAVREGPFLTDNILSYIDYSLKKNSTKLKLKSYLPQSNFLKILNFGDGTAICDYYGWSFSSWLIWHLKDYIDKKFMNTFSIDF